METSDSGNVDCDRLYQYWTEYDLVKDYVRGSVASTYYSTSN